MDLINKILKNRPDLLLLDISLRIPPDGIEICKSLKADDRTKDIPVIMLTANDNTESVEKCFEFGADDYVFKPFNIPDLLLKMRKYLALSKKNEYNNS